ncbi:hypothetical protein M2341_001284 [Sphingobium sp. B7D2B]|uniref:hypothetical protein n=1 Tax=Sphingobium sp. B7D2B TaxID=2940583 RepID=UPI0022255D8B|nr:hypothetical protein [Sphingobium sp. B7D2B]MCW2365837.1 hypothetical protein [Sphingobium sp. B7D2B]
MLVVSAEIWPGGDESRAWLVGEIIASNESALSPVSSYAVSISQALAPAIGIEGWERELTVQDHHRRDGVWALVAAIVEQALNPRSSDDCPTDQEGSVNGDG